MEPAVSASAFVWSMERQAPPAKLWVFSRQRRLVWGWRTAVGKTAASTCAGLMRPCSPLTVLGVSPPKAARNPASLL